MKELSTEQRKAIRSSKGSKTAKQLAKELKVPKKLVEAELEALAASPATAGKEPTWLLAFSAVLVLLLGYVSYSGTLSHTEFHFDDDHTIKSNRAIRSYYDRVHGENVRTDLSGADVLKRKVWAVGEASEEIFAFNTNRAVTYWSFTLSYDSYPFDKSTTIEERDERMAGWHWTNLQIHLFNGLLALWLAYLTFTAPVFRGSSRATAAPIAAATLAAVIFTCHPIQTQAVTYLAQRTESLCATFYLLSLCCYAAARIRSLGPHAGKAPWKTGWVLGGGVGVIGVCALLAVLGVTGFGLLSKVFVVVALGAGGALTWLCKKGDDERVHALLSAGSFLAFVFALLSKEIAATIPLAIVAWDLCFVRGKGEAQPAKLWVVGSLRRGLRDRGRDLGAWGVVTAAAFLAAVPVAGRNIVAQFGTATEAGGEGGTRLIGPVQYLMTQANVFWTYVRVSILPYGQNLDYDYAYAGYSLGDGATWLALLSGAALLACVGLAIWRGGHARIVTFAFALTLLVLAPTSSLIVLADVIYEHRFYIPLLGLALGFTALVSRIARYGLGPDKEARVVWALALVLGGVLTGLTVARNQVWETETSLWRDVTSKSPEKPRGWTNLGLAYLNVEPQRIEFVDGQSTEGQVVYLDDDTALVKSMRTELMGQPPVRVQKSKISSVTKLDGGPKLASEAFLKAIELDPKYTKAHNNLSLAQISIAKLKQAEVDAVVEYGKACDERAKQLMQQPKTPETEAEVKRLFDVARKQSDRFNVLKEEIGEHLKIAEESLKSSIAVKEAQGKQDVILMSNLGNFYASQLDDLEQAFHWVERSFTAPNGIPVSRVTAATIRVEQSKDLYSAGAAKGVPHEELVKQCTPLWEDARDLFRAYLTGKGTDPQFVKVAREGLAQVERFLAGQFEDPKQAPPGVPGLPPR